MTQFCLPLVELAVFRGPDQRPGVGHPSVDESEQPRVLGFRVPLGEGDLPHERVVEGWRGAQILLAVVALLVGGGWWGGGGGSEKKRS